MEFICVSCYHHRIANHRFELSGSPEHQGTRAVSPLQDHRLPETVSRGVQPRCSERKATRSNDGTSPVL